MARASNAAMEAACWKQILSFTVANTWRFPLLQGSGSLYRRAGLRIPVNPSTCSGPNRPLIPDEIDHPFRRSRPAPLSTAGLSSLTRLFV